MDRMSPLDLERMQLPSAFRGYERKAVQVAFARAAREMEWLLNELKDAKREAAKLYEELERYRGQERQLQDTLKLAQRAADDTRAAAHKEAEAIVELARAEADSMRDRASAATKDVRWELERLRLQRDDFEHKFRALLEAHLHDLGGPQRQPVLVNVETVLRSEA